MSLVRTEAALHNAPAVYAYFARKYGVADAGVKARSRLDVSLSQIMEEGEEYAVSGQRIKSKDTADTYALLLLAFLDAMGYIQRTSRKNPLELFRGILERYLHACKKFQSVCRQHQFMLGRAVVRTGDAREIEMGTSAVDGILFSPPYSFAIDYVENDAFHLDALGVNRQELYEKMIGIRGGAKLSDKFVCYIDDMRQVLKECYRVLRSGRYCVVVIGTNSNQLTRVLNTTRENLAGLHEIIRNEAQSIGFSFVSEIARVFVCCMARNSLFSARWLEDILPVSHSNAIYPSGVSLSASKSPVPRTFDPSFGNCSASQPLLWRAWMHGILIIMTPLPWPLFLPLSG